MTVATVFESWQESPLPWDEPPFEDCSPNLLSLRDWLLSTFGGMSLGCHGDRPIRDGSSISSHAYGAALDWRYAPSDTNAPGDVRWPGRDAVLAHVLPLVIANSAELGIQAIHDYLGSRIWRPPGTSGRPADGDGWRTQRPGSQMGKLWALWLHFEVHPDAWDDGRPVIERAPALAPSTGDGSAPPPVPPPVVPSPLVPRPSGPLAPGGSNVVTVTAPTIRRGSTGGWVRKAQVLLQTFNQDVGPVDGAYGPRTEEAVRNVQAFFAASDPTVVVDGIVGGQTWRLLFGQAPA